MNIPQAIEQALYAAIRARQMIADTHLRCWHNPAHDQAWNADRDRHLPCVEIRCSPPRAEESAKTFACAVQIIAVTDPGSDRDRAGITRLETAAQDAIDALYTEFYAGAGSTYAAFRAAIQAAEPTLHLGGLSYGEPLAPYSDEGNQAVGVGLVVHFSRTGLN